MPRAPTNVQGTELRARDREIFEIEGSRDREILLYKQYCGGSGKIIISTELGVYNKAL